MEESPHPLYGENERLLFVLVVSVGAAGALSVHAFRSAKDAAAFQQYGSVHLTAELHSIDGRPAAGTLVQFKSFAALCSPDHWVVSVSVHTLIRGAFSEDWAFEDLGAYGDGQRERFLSAHRRERTSVEPRRNSLHSRKLVVGRHAEFEEVLRQLTANRISWLLGLPGTGKSELARLIWESSEPEPSPFPVRYVDLQSAKDGGLAGHAVLRQLDARKAPMETPWAAISRTLASFSGGLILDLSEPDLLTAPEQLPALLDAAPHLHVLLVSRTPSSGSTLPRYVLAGLECPGEGVAYPEVLQFDAVKLFEDRCQTISPRFRVNEKNAEEVSELVREVSGNPLAIETLAKNVTVFSPRQLLRRLKDRVRSFPRAKDPFSASLDVWLQDQAAEDILILRLLGEVASPVTYEDVAALADGLLPSGGVIRVFRSLVTNSLVVEDPGWDDKRFFIESNVARWVRANHVPWDEADFRRRRATWVMGLCRKDGESKFPDLDATFTDLAAVAEGDVEDGVQIAILSHRHWIDRGFLAEAFQLLKRLGTEEGVVRTAGYPQLLNITCYIAAEVGEFSAARLAAKEAIRLATKTGDFSRLLGGWSGLAHTAYVGGQPERGLRISVRIWRRWIQRSDDPLRPMIACNVLAHAAQVPRDSLIHLHEATVKVMSEVLRVLAVPQLEPMLEGTRCMNLLDWRITGGDFTDIPELLERGWQAFAETRNVSNQARILRNAAYWRVAMGDAAGAVRLFACARQLPYAVSRPAELARSEKQLSELRRILGSEKYHEEFLRGDLSDPEEVLKEIITGI